MHNRYAPLKSVEEPPRLLDGPLKVYCPLESSSNGTWIGFNEAGLFAAVTDQHTDNRYRPYRSRGLLMLDILKTFSEADEGLEHLKRELIKGYRRSNFILADSEHAYHILHDERLEVEELGSGAHIFTNLTIREWMKTDQIPHDRLLHVEKRRRRALHLVSNIKRADIDGIIEELKVIASDHGDGEAGRGSICYHNGVGWYMSSSTIIAVSSETVRSRIFYCQENPCRNPYVDYSNILLDGGGVEVAEKTGKLRGRRIALCLTGSVAAIEAPKLARELRRHGADVTCYMTEAAMNYGVSREVMEWATGKPVISNLTGVAEHLTPYDLVIVYPATLNTIGKIALGIADNAVSTLCASTRPSKLLIAPAMNLKLYENRALKRNIEWLRGMGVTFVEPRISEGIAKIAHVDTAVDYVIRQLSDSRLKGRRILILTGPTRYDLDPVRYISNKSTGRLGLFLAKEAFHRGCDVKVIYGPGTVKFPSHIPVVNVYTVEDMLNEALNELGEKRYEAAIFSAAILDFKPDIYIERKVKSNAPWNVKLSPTIKVIEEVYKRHPYLKIVGFKLEYNVSKEQLIKSGLEELKRINASLVVANDLSRIRGDRHEAYLIDGRGTVIEFDGTKMELAQRIFDVLERKIIHS